MKGIKFIIHESYEGKKSLSEIFATLFLSEIPRLTENKIDSRIYVNDQFQDSLCSAKGANNGTSEE